MRLLTRGWFWLLLILVLLLPPFALLAGLSTEKGSAWMLRQAGKVAQPLGFEFAFAQSRGTLIDRLELQGMSFKGAGVEFAASALVLQWRPRALLERELHIEHLSVVDANLVTPPSEETESGLPQIPEIKLPVRVRIDRIELANGSIQQQDSVWVVQYLALSALLNEQALAVSDLSFDMDGLHLQGRLSMAPEAPHEIGGMLSTQVKQPLLDQEIGEFAATLTLQGNALAPVLAMVVSQPADLRLDGELKLAQAKPAFELAAVWSKLAWPLHGEADYVTDAGRLVVEGTADDYRLKLSTKLTGEGLPAAELDLNATGDTGGLRLQPLLIKTLGGDLQADGSVRWDSGTQWDLNLLARQIDPGLYQTDWPGRLDARIDLTGSAGGDGGLALRAQVHELKGQLRDQPVKGGGLLILDGDRWTAQGFRVSSGKNKVAIDGEAGEQLNLRFDIDAPDLAALYPGLSGQLLGNGRLRGKADAPIVLASLKGQNLGYQQHRAQDLTLDIDWAAQGGTGRLLLSGLDSGEIKGGEVEAEVSGTPQAHRLTLAARTDPVKLTMAASGGIQQQAWAGKLNALVLDSPDFGEWTLAEPVGLRLGAALVRTERLCLRQAETRLCSEGGWEQAKGLDLKGVLSDLDLDRLAPYLPEESRIDGKLDASFNATGPVDRPKVDFELLPGNGTFQATQEGQPFELAYRNARLRGGLENDRGRLDINLELGERGRAQGQLTLGADQGGQRALGGTLTADFPDLSMVAGFAPALEELKGALQLQTRLAGTLAAPQVFGELKIIDASARVPPAGITLEDVTLAVSGDGDSPLRIRGGMRSGGGELKLEGTLNVRAAGGQALDLRITGEHFQAARLPEAEVEVSPDLRLRGKGPYHLSGKLLIPAAKVEIRDLPSGAIPLSDDEIIVGETVEAPAEAAPSGITAKVRVELGDEVSFKGFGLTTGLTGAVDAETGKAGTRVDGKIELSDGLYQSYGQDLTVERGRLLFAGPPGNPDVDLRAVRVSRDGQVKAYLAMQGPLSKPRSRVYSEPTLPEAEALAYLLTGRGLDQAGKREGVDIAGAALSLGLSKSEPLLQELSGRLGLDELTIDSGENGIEESSLVLGKYLNPDLYLGYSQGLFNPEGAILLRLRMSEHLDLESKSGNEQSVDLLYRIEYD